MTEICEGTSGSLFDHWREVVQTIGHQDFPFLSGEYSPSSRIPCRGFVEWIADALLAGELDSIARLLCEIVRANPGVSSGDIDLMDTFGRLPRDLSRIKLQETIIGLDSKQLAALVSAYLLQATIEGYQEEFVLIHPGRFLMAASVLPWDFEIVAAEECIRRANSFIKRMRKDTPFWQDIPLYNIQNLSPFETHDLESLTPLRRRLIPISVSARMHFLDAIGDCKGGLARRPLAGCTSFDTRRFGCDLKETCGEILASDLIETNVNLEICDKWFKKNELQEILSRRGVAFRKSARHGELFALACEQTPEDLQSKVHEKGIFAIDIQVRDMTEVLLAFYQHEASRLAVWAAGALVPRLREVRGARGVFLGG